MNFDKNVVFDNNIIAKKAFKMALNTKSSMLITGAVSTGKTVLKNMIIEFTNKKYIILAPNDREARNIGEVSIESFFKIPKNTLDIELEFLRNLEYHPEHLNLIKEIDLIIIDEVSQLSSLLLDILNKLLQEIRGNLNPLGGIQLILVGDLFEESPDLNKTDVAILKRKWKSQYFFDAKCYENLMIANFDLRYDYEKSYNFYTKCLLLSLRHNCIIPEELNNFNNFHCNYEGGEIENKIIITTDREFANKINHRKYNEMIGKEYYANCEVFGEIDLEALPVEQVICLKYGMKVVLINNEFINGKYKNGTIGTFKYQDGDILYIETEKYKTVEIKKVDWHDYEYSINNANNKFEKLPINRFSQYPIKFGWAISIADSKRMSFDNLHFENKGDVNLKDSQAYWIYKRFNGELSLTVSIPFRRDDIKVDPNITAFYDEKIVIPFNVDEMK